MNKLPGGFTVKGQANDTVDWFVIAVRAGFENIRFRDVQDPEPLGLYDPWDARNRKNATNNTAGEPARRPRAVLPSAQQARLAPAEDLHS